MGTVRITVERVDPTIGPDPVRSWDQVNKDRRMARGWSPAQIVQMFTLRRPRRSLLAPRSWRRVLPRTDQSGPAPKGWTITEGSTAP